MAPDYGWHLEKDISDYIFEWTELIEICKTEIEGYMKSALKYNNLNVYNQLQEYLKQLTKLDVNKSNQMENLKNDSDTEYLKNILSDAIKDAFEILIAGRKYYNQAQLRSSIPRYSMPMLASNTLNMAAERLMQYQQQNPPIQTISRPSIARLQAPTIASRARSQHKFAPTQMPMPGPVQQPTRKQAKQEFQKYQPRIIETQNTGKELLNRAQASIAKSSQTNNQSVQQIIRYSNELTKGLYNLQIVSNSSKPAGCLNTIRAVSNQMNKLNNALTDYEKIKAQKAKLKAVYQPNASVEPINYQSRSDSICRPRTINRRSIPAATRYRNSINLGEKGYHRSQIRKIKNQIQNEMKNHPKRRVIVPHSLNAFMPEGLIIDKQIMDGIFWDLYSDDSMKSLQIERMLNDPQRKSDYIAGVKRMNEYESAVLEYFKAKLLHRFEGYGELLP